MHTLTEAERMQLRSLEATVDAGVSATLAMIDAGKALATIRDRQLYRDSAASWELYVETRFRITRRRADQVISFAGVSEVIETVSQKTGTAVPVLSERAIRPLVGMAPETIKAVVAEAAEEADGITPATLRKAASRRKPAKAKAPRPRRYKVPGAIVTVVFNRKASGSAVEALAAAMRQAEDELQRQATEAA